MGCLFEILVLPFEFIFETVIGGWYDLMTWIIPSNIKRKSLRFFLKALIVIECCVLAYFEIIGLIIVIFDDSTVIELWKLTLLPLGISLIQILIGAVIHFTVKKSDGGN